MRKFSNKISTFFKGLDKDNDFWWQMVPKSQSAADPGDIVFFKYRLSSGVFGGYRLFMVIEPIVFEASTGNLLMTGFKVPPEGDYTAESVISLYKNKELPKENYRTYRLNRIYGPLRRLHIEKRKDI
jgi:hypothetical protein